jgi:hypothetical protein
MTRIVLRPVASSLPLGFLAFGVGTILLTALTVLRTPPGGTSTSLGIFLLTLAAMMLVLSAGALRSKPLSGALLMTGACRFGLAGLGVLATQSPAGMRPGGGQRAIRPKTRPRQARPRTVQVT